MKTLKNIVFVTLPTLVILLLILEITSRLFFPGSEAPKTYWDEENRIIKFNHENGSEGTWTMGKLGQRKATWHINNQGWNSPVDYYPEKKEGAKRIAIIGDSFVEALHIDIQQSFSYLLDEKLGQDVEVYTFGFSGAPLSHYLHMGRYVEDVYSPDLYIFNVYYNDFDESLNEVQENDVFLTYSLQQDSLREIQPDYSRTYKKLPFASILKKSSLVRLLYSNLHVNQMFVIKDEDQGKTEMNVHVDKVFANKENLTNATAYTIQMIKKELGHKKILFIMDAPRDNIYSNSLNDATVTELNKMVAADCAENNIPFINLTPYMAADFAENHKRFESKYDNHWNEYGHQFVANVLYDFILTHKTLE